MPIDLTGRVCLITGAAAGIGETMAQSFTKRGATVVATDVQAPSLSGVAASLAWDVSQPARAEEVVAEVVRRFGRLDAFVANAGIYPPKAWDQITPDDWRRMVSVNLDGTWHGAQAAARVMVKQSYGKIVTVSSVTVEAGRGDLAHYVSTKAGIIGMTRSLARALGKSGVRVNCIMPGAVQTAGEIKLYPDQEAVAKELAEVQSLPHRMVPADIEPAFAFLCSAESDAITGQVLCVDHGLVHYAVGCASAHLLFAPFMNGVPRHTLRQCRTNPSNSPARFMSPRRPTNYFMTWAWP